MYGAPNSSNNQRISSPLIKVWRRKIYYTPNLYTLLYISIHYLKIVYNTINKIKSKITSLSVRLSSALRIVSFKLCSLLAQLKQIPIAKFFSNLLLSKSCDFQPKEPTGARCISGCSTVASGGSHNSSPKGVSLKPPANGASTYAALRLCYHSSTAVTDIPAAAGMSVPPLPDPTPLFVTLYSPEAN